MKMRIIIAAALGATLALGGCSKTENTNVSVNETTLTGDNLSDTNDLAGNVDNMSDGGDSQKNDPTHP
ncbi:PBP1b-binding outer membrane lipoprotein LpoB [Sphingomonas vulcanisoli]|uniref:PBP1b-binding outer membrane lipoprotein LpoB n=1 Tax=Sphingomonas vulcanisoli TaxID=1658060 RepID=A0ABX0TMD2_9SPHN|nr:hypothetical protein [Sphingomonas vulcanisoli]NIJ06684.1 PBP1b-binding outer membrane lipoprotein LpoB [Sphingomonas vulcanisoli]